MENQSAQEGNQGGDKVVVQGGGEGRPENGEAGEQKREGIDQKCPQGDLKQFCNRRSIIESGKN